MLRLTHSDIIWFLLKMLPYPVQWTVRKHIQNRFLQYNWHSQSTHFILLAPTNERLDEDPHPTFIRPPQSFFEVFDL